MKILNVVGYLLACYIMSGCGGGCDAIKPSALNYGSNLLNPVIENVFGLSVGNGLQITLTSSEGSESKVVTSNGSFNFASKFISGTKYNIVVTNQPTGQTCNIDSSSFVSSKTVQPVNVVCTNNVYEFRTMVTGLQAGKEITLSNTLGSTTKTVDISSNGIAIDASVVNSTNFSVAVTQQPVGETCNVSQYAGDLYLTPVDVTVLCIPNEYSVDLTTSGLLGGNTISLLLTDKTINIEQSVIVGNGNLMFSKTLLSDDFYSLSIVGNPTGQTCSLVNSDGQVVDHDVSDLQVQCVPNQYNIGVNVTGMLGAFYGKVSTLSMNSGDNMPWNQFFINGDANFGVPVVSGSSYHLTINAQPTGQTCVFTDSVDGVVTDANIVKHVVCTTNSFKVGGSSSGMMLG